MDSEIEISDVIEDVSKSGGILVAVALGLVTIGIGVGIGYILGRRKKYEVIKLGDRLPENRPRRVVIDEDQLNRDIKTIDPSDVEEEVVEKEVTVTVNEKVVTETNIFAHAEDDEWNYDEEIKKRSPLAPYVLHRDEFFGEEMAFENYMQCQWTYYAGDDTLVDDDEKPVYNYEMVVGDLRWGHGSGDPNVVYVRNMTRNQEYEITRDPGHYRVEVLGLEMEQEADEQEKRRAKKAQSRIRQE